MDAGPSKRRKLSHSEPSSDTVLQSAASVGLSKSRAFVLEADELLREVALDYEAAFKGADALLHKVKSSIEAIQPHESLPVCITSHLIPCDNC